MTPVTYVLQKKNLPVPDGLPDESTEDALSAEQEVDDGRQWAGEPYEGTDAPQGPEGAYSVFTHPNGESAWLDRADDGTLTGWVKANDGTLYQYSDADAWAVDVDGAGMAMVEGQGPTGDASLSDEQSVEDEQADTDQLTDAADAAVTDDLAGEDPDGFEDDDEEEEPADPADLEDFADDAPGGAGDEGQDDDQDDTGWPGDDPEGDTEDEESDEDEDDDEDNPVTRFTKGSEGKYLVQVVRK